jgi:hypothetical protein
MGEIEITMQNEKKREILLVVLWAAIEDYVPLFEIPWELNSVYDSIDSIGMSRKILTRFIYRDFIEIFKGEYNDLKKINDIETSIDLLNEEEYWEASDEYEKIIRISATEKGVKFYKEIYSANNINVLYPDSIE